MSSGTGNLGENTAGAGSNLKPYLKRKKSSLGETKIAVLGADGVGKSGKYFIILNLYVIYFSPLIYILWRLSLSTHFSHFNL